jgi:cysteinyl-tRNA synthetase
LFEGVKIINSINDGKETISKEDLELLKKTFKELIFDVLGLKEEKSAANNDELVNNLMELVIKIREEAKAKKDFATSDEIRNGLAKTKISIKDTKEGVVWLKEK